jgi:hypothetical protein
MSWKSGAVDDRLGGLAKVKMFVSVRVADVIQAEGEEREKAPVYMRWR